METANTPYRVHQCSKCPGDTEYHCVSCPCDLCPQCKENHVKDLQTIDHNVVSYRDKINYFPTQEICVKHPSHVYTKYCEPCQVPVCDFWFKHNSDKRIVRPFLCEQRKHNMLDLLKAFKKKRQKHKGTIHSIRSDALFYRHVLLPQIKADFNACHTDLSLCQSKMLKKAKKLDYLIDFLFSDLINNAVNDFNVKLRNKMTIHIVTLQRYEHIYEQSANSPLHFLSTIKTTLSQIYLTLHTGKFSVTESFNKEDVMESLSAIQITEKRDQRLGNESLLKLAFGAEFHQSLAATGVSSCRHISYQTLGRVWVSDEKNNLILTDKTGVPLHRVEDLCTYASIGLHTVSTKNELIYIDRNDDIKKLSKDMKRTETFVKSTDYLWQTQCVYCSPFTGDLLVGMQRKYSGPGKVMRYNPSGQQTQTIQHDNTGQELYSQPNYITENNNGDIVVSDYRTGTVLISDIYRLSLCGYGTVVVTERGGRHCFSYTGPPSGSKIRPFGVCTDELSNILVCDDISRTIHIIEKDGQLLLYLWISEMFAPCSLTYDVSTHRIWIGSFFNNRIVIYRYKDCQHPLSDLNQDTAVMESLSEAQSKETKRQQCFEMIPSPNLLHSVTLKDVFWFCHIAFVTSDLVWISDSRNNLILTDTTGVPLHRLEDLCSRVYGGIHTVNSKSELIYIGRNHNIYKLSKDLKTTAIFIERTDSTWEPRCVYCSSYTGDLLVAMDNNFPSFGGIKLGRNNYRAATGKVTRYDQSGKLTQTIQYDNNGLELYRDPIFITENRNRDVVVSDEGAVVVTERGGRHRFSYTGHPSRSGLEPHGICTDALSHILVCDKWTNTVQMLDKDGLFLLHLLTIPHDEVRSLGYDINTDYLWVGSRWKGKLCVYSYITRQDALTDEHRPGPDGDTWSN